MQFFTNLRFWVDFRKKQLRDIVNLQREIKFEKIEENFFPSQKIF